MSETNTKQDCDHLIPDPIISKETPASELGYRFCPKCGAKL